MCRVNGKIRQVFCVQNAWASHVVVFGFAERAIKRCVCRVCEGRVVGCLSSVMSPKESAMAEWVLILRLR